MTQWLSDRLPDSLISNTSLLSERLIDRLDEWVSECVSESTKCGWNRSVVERNRWIWMICELQFWVWAPHLNLAPTAPTSLWFSTTVYKKAMRLRRTISKFTPGGTKMLAELMLSVYFKPSIFFISSCCFRINEWGETSSIDLQFYQREED